MAICAPLNFAGCITNNTDRHLDISKEIPGQPAGFGELTPVDLFFFEVTTRRHGTECKPGKRTVHTDMTIHYIRALYFRTSPQTGIASLHSYGPHRPIHRVARIAEVIRDGFAEHH